MRKLLTTYEYGRTSIVDTDDISECTRLPAFSDGGQEESERTRITMKSGMTILVQETPEEIFSCEPQNSSN